MPAGEITVDVLVLGGGVTGLWTLARLRNAGYSALLLEADALGSGQSIASQGIIHGGIKYSLGPAGARAAKAISAMPAIWQACLNGTGEVDLRGTTVLSDHQYMWTTGGIASRLAGLAASKAIRTEVAKVKREDYPGAFVSAPKSVDLYCVEEPVLDPSSLLERLAASQEGAIVRATEGELRNSDREGATVAFMQPGGELAVRARRLVLAAGAANEQLARAAARSAMALADAPRMQRRPLHMVLARAAPGVLPEVYGHCVTLSDKPRITVTTQVDAGGRRVWYIGGELAEKGVGRSRDEQINAALEEVRDCLPWVEMLAVQWATFEIDRAEGLDADGKRPDEPVALAAGPAIAVWPTKLAFAPAAAERVMSMLVQQGVEATGRVEMPDPVPTIMTPKIAPLPWEDKDLQWS